MLFGIEQEHFIFRDGKSPTLQEIFLFFNALKKEGFSEHVTDSNGRPLSVALGTSHGQVIIKNDFCTHILEIAFPPLNSVLVFERLYKEVVGRIGDSLSTVGCNIKYGGSLDHVPIETVLVPNDNNHNKARLEHLLNRPLPNRRYTDRKFNAAISATQIHLNVFDRSFYKIMPSLYSFEYLFPLLFSNSKTFIGYSAHCVRPLIYRDNFSPSYKACAFPDPVPNTEASYDKMLSKSEHFIRDYTFIAPRTNGTVEYRSGCSQNESGDIVNMLALRVATYYAAENGKRPYSRQSKEVFYQVCEAGFVPTEILETDLVAISNTKNVISNTLWKPLSSVLEKMQFILDKN